MWYASRDKAQLILWATTINQEWFILNWALAKVHGGHSPANIEKWPLIVLVCPIPVNLALYTREI